MDGPMYTKDLSYLWVQGLSSVNATAYYEAGKSHLDTNLKKYF